MNKIYKKSNKNYDKFNESMSILNINPKELDQFITIDQNNNPMSFMMEKFEEEFDHEILNIN